MHENICEKSEVENTFYQDYYKIQKSPFYRGINTQLHTQIKYKKTVHNMYGGGSSWYSMHVHNDQLVRIGYSIMRS